MPSKKTDIRLHEIEHDSFGWSVRIEIPHYDPERPTREVSAGWFMGEPRGILIRVTDIPDLRFVANALLEAADQLEREQP